MKVLIDIGHPAHVHFFKNFIRTMAERGHQTTVTARDKDVTHKLLDAYGIKYIPVGKMGKGGLRLAAEWLGREKEIYSIARKFKPDILLGIHNHCVAQVARLISSKAVIFTDTEHARLSNILTFPFASVICTPSCFRKNLGKKQVRYDGYHELAYLHPDYFRPDPSVLKYIGLKQGDKFAVVRFVAWKAIHDINQHGFSSPGKRRLLEELEKKAPVFITSEKPLPEEFRQYSTDIPLQMLHDLLYYAGLCVSEGGTTATEAAVLGTPAIHMSTTAHYCGNFDDMNQNYGLIETCSEENVAINRAIELLDNGKTKSEWQQKRQKMLDEKIDVTRFMLKLAENYANSGKRKGIS